MASDIDHSFNRIDGELRQIEDYINDLEAKLIKIQKPRLVKSDVGVLMRDYAAGLREDARRNRTYDRGTLHPTAGWIERKADEIDRIVEERDRTNGNNRMHRISKTGMAWLVRDWLDGG